MWRKEWGAIEQVAIFSGTKWFVFPCLGLEKVEARVTLGSITFPDNFPGHFPGHQWHPQWQRPKARKVNSLVSRGPKHLDFR